MKKTKIQATSIKTFIIKNLGREGKSNTFESKICQALTKTEKISLRINKENVL